MDKNQEQTTGRATDAAKLQYAYLHFRHLGQRAKRAIGNAKFLILCQEAGIDGHPDVAKLCWKGRDAVISHLSYVYGQEQNHLHWMEHSSVFVSSEQRDAQTLKCHAAAKALYDAGGDINERTWEDVSRSFQVFTKAEGRN